MGPIPPDKSWEEIDREAVEMARARRASGAKGPTYPADRVHQLLLELERRFTQAGTADPAIIRELLDDLRREAKS
jgi:hypothetical protein